MFRHRDSLARRRLNPAGGPLWFSAKRWRGLSRKGKNRSRIAENAEERPSRGERDGRMTVSQRERPDAALAIERRHGPRARRPPRGMRLRQEAAPRVAATVWVMSSRRL